MARFDYPPTQHPDGSLEYDSTPPKWQYPREMPGYERDPENPFKLNCVWNPCVHRHSKMRRLNCGQAAIDNTCGCESCPLHRQKLTPHDCDFCDHQEEPE